VSGGKFLEGILYQMIYDFINFSLPRVDSKENRHNLPYYPCHPREGGDQGISKDFLDFYVFDLFNEYIDPRLRGDDTTLLISNRH
jgi:hypothetical protein